jgi:hypothetical protein
MLRTGLTESVLICLDLRKIFCLDNLELLFIDQRYGSIVNASLAAIVNTIGVFELFLMLI